MKPFRILAALALALVSATGANAAQYKITIAKMAFGPVPAHLVIGDTIVWTNADMFRHTVTASTKAFDLDLQPRQSGTITLTEAGTITVYCRYHPTMKVALSVQAK
jgi:plastocyanin